MRLDHVIYATADLDEAAARVESELGLSVMPGGRHEGHGTHNRIVPLGGGYLELMAVADPHEAADSPMGSAVQARLTEQGDGLFAWVVVLDGVEQFADRLGLPVITVAREGLSARVAGLLRRCGIRFFLSSSNGMRVWPIRVRGLTPAESRGSRWPATAGPSRAGSATPSFRSGWWMDRLA